MNWFNKFATLFAVVVVVQADNKVDEERDLGDMGALIVGGTQVTDPTAYPWVVSLQQGSHYCGGTLIHPNWVLTAAHCGPGKPDLLRMNTLRHSKGGITRNAKRMIVHPNYNGNTMANDIALVELSSPVNNVVIPNLPPASNDPNDDTGVSLKVIGWGTTSSGSSNIPAVLRQVVVPVISNQQCQKAYPKENIISSMICAGFDKGGKDSCQGDSGGPFFKEGAKTDTIEGVVSWGYGCASAGAPGVYTRVNMFLNWISKYVPIDPTTPTDPQTKSPTKSPLGMSTPHPTKTDPYDEEYAFCSTFNRYQCRRHGNRCRFNRKSGCIPRMRPPTQYPTSRPTKSPTKYPTRRPTKEPTAFPTVSNEYEYEYETGF